MGLKFSVTSTRSSAKVARNLRLAEAVREHLSNLVQQRLEDRYKINIGAVSAQLNQEVSAVYRDAFEVAASVIVGRVTSTQLVSKGLSARRRYAAASGGTTEWGFSAKPIFGATSLPGGKNSLWTSNKTPIPASAAKMPFHMSWKNLSEKTLRNKQSRFKVGASRAARYFMGIGDLQKSLKTLASQSRLQLVSVTSNARPRDERGRFIKKEGNRDFSVTLDSLKIKILPTVPSSYLPGLTGLNYTRFDPTMQFEKTFLGISGKELHKLQGPRGVHRPLLQPIITYYTLFKAPEAVSKAINGIMRRI